MSDTIEAPATALATLRSNNLVTAFHSDGGIEAIVAAVEQQARAQAGKLDVTKPKDRQALISLAYKVSQSKVILDDTGKDLGAAAKKIVDGINADRRLGRERLEALRDELQAPVERFKKIEAERIEGHETALANVRAMAEVDGLRAEEIKTRIWQVPPADARDWQEYEAKARETFLAVLNALHVAHAEALAREAAEIETARLKLIEAERIAAENEAKRIEREAQIARDAAAKAIMQAEAEQARKDQAAALALAQAQETANRIAADAEANRIKGHQDALLALKLASIVPTNASSATILAIIEAFKRRPARVWDEFAQQAHDDTAAALIRLEACLTHAESYEADAEAAADALRRAEAEQAQRTAVKGEQDRLAAIAQVQQAADAARAADVDHRKRINTAALADLVPIITTSLPVGLTLAEALGKAIIRAIAQDSVANVRIHY